MKYLRLLFSLPLWDCKLDHGIDQSIKKLKDGHKRKQEQGNCTQPLERSIVISTVLPFSPFLSAELYGLFAVSYNPMFCPPSLLSKRQFVPPVDFTTERLYYLAFPCGIVY